MFYLMSHQTMRKKGKLAARAKVIKALIHPESRPTTMTKMRRRVMRMKQMVM
jgi:hypothetical protein